jgi:hypothetical protein
MKSNFPSGTKLGIIMSANPKGPGSNPGGMMYIEDQFGWSRIKLRGHVYIDLVLPIKLLVTRH